MNPDKLFFTSDTHFGHKLVVRTGMRPFTDVDTMDAHLILEWNRTVPEDGVVILAGDVSFRGPTRTYEILQQLHGEIHLVRGNHDVGLKPLVLSRFASVEWRQDIDVDGQRIVITHEPLASWAGVHHGFWHLHGHSHGTCPPLGKRMDVGVDCHGLRPISFHEVARYMATRKIESGDGHRPGMHEGNIKP